MNAENVEFSFYFIRTFRVHQL